MTKYEVALQFLTAQNLPSHQTDNLGVLESQVLKVALDLYTKRLVNLDEASLEETKQLVRGYFNSVQGMAMFLMIVGVDIHHFRMTSLSRYLEVPPEMQIKDIIDRLTTRCCDLVNFDDAGDIKIGAKTGESQDVVCGLNGNAEDIAIAGEKDIKEKGKEEGKEEIPPHTPLKEKGQEESEKERLSNARAREELKKRKEEKKRKDAELRKNDEMFQRFFEELWKLYPKGRKNLKEKCETKIWEHYKTADDKDAFITKVIASLNEHINCSQWKRRVIPLASTWFDQHRWTEAAPDGFGDNRPVRGVSQTANVKSTRKDLW